MIGTFLTDDWDDRIDALGRGVLGLSVACARCHDHKFDPILTKDYYALQGVFASTMLIERPMFDVDPETETRYLWVQRRLFDLHYAADNLTNEASTVDNAAAKVAKWTAEIESLKQDMSRLEGSYPQLPASLEKYYSIRVQTPGNALPAANAANAQAAAGGTPRRRPQSLTDPFMNAVYDPRRTWTVPIKTTRSSTMFRERRQICPFSAAAVSPIQARSCPGAFRRCWRREMLVLRRDPAAWSL